MKRGSSNKKVIKLRKKKRFIGTGIGNKLIVVAILAAIGIGIFLGLRPNAYQVTIKGKVVGAIKDKAILEEAKATVISQLKSLYQADVKFEEDAVLMRYRAKKRDYIDPSYLVTYMRKNMDVLIAFKEIYVEGKSIGIVASDNEVEELKALLKVKYYGNKEVKVDFGKKVEVKEVFAKEDQLINKDLLVEKCIVTTAKSVEYEVKSGDTLWGIANKFGVSTENIIKETPELSEKQVLKIGNIVKARVNEPLLPLIIIEDLSDKKEEEKKEE